MRYRIAVSLLGPHRPQWRWATDGGDAVEFETRADAELNAESLSRDCQTEIIEGPPFNLPAVPRALPEENPAPAPSAPKIRHVVVDGAGGAKFELKLETEGEPPEFTIDEIKDSKARQYFDKQAAAILDALQLTLPGGTIDSILHELMRRKASVFRVLDFTCQKPCSPNAACPECRPYWERMKSEGLYSEGAWSEEAIREASR